MLKARMGQVPAPGPNGDWLGANFLPENRLYSPPGNGKYLWVAKTLLTGLKNFSNDTLPGYAEYRNEVSYYILSKSKVAELINSSYNPYRVTISSGNLKIAE